MWLLFPLQPVTNYSLTLVLSVWPFLFSLHTNPICFPGLRCCTRLFSLHNTPLRFVSSEMATCPVLHSNFHSSTLQPFWQMDAFAWCWYLIFWDFQLCGFTILIPELLSHRKTKPLHLRNDACFFCITACITLVMLLVCTEVHYNIQATCGRENWDSIFSHCCWPLSMRLKPIHLHIVSRQALPVAFL